MAMGDDEEEDEKVAYLALKFSGVFGGILQ